MRKQGIGSSDAAAACGLNPYMSMLELWMIKTGRVQQNIEDESSGHAPLYWGKQLEPLVAEYYSMHTNNKVRRVNAVLQHPDPDKAFMLANLDYAVVGNEEVQILECKTAGEYGAKLWQGRRTSVCTVSSTTSTGGDRQASGTYLCVAVWAGNQNLQSQYGNEALIEQIIQAERLFWECVENDVPPAVDASESAAKALQQLYPEHTPLSCVDLTEVELANELFDQLIQEKQQIEQHQSQFDLLKHRVQALMQEHERAVFQQGSVTWKKSKDSISLDIKSLLQHQPELIQQYPLQKAGSRRFNIYHD